MNSKSIYEVPILYYNVGLDKAVLDEVAPAAPSAPAAQAIAAEQTIANPTPESGVKER